MRRLLALAFLACLGSSGQAFASPEVVYTDGTTTICGAQGFPCSIGVNAQGKEYTPATTSPTFISNSVASGTFNDTAYHTVLTNPSNKAKYIDCTNGLDKEIRLSSDATNDTLGAIPSGSGKIIPLAQVGLYVNTNISAKAIAAATSGNVTCTLGY